MDSWFFLLVLLPLIIASFVLNNNNNKKTTKNSDHHPPGPPRLPIIGNLHQFDSAKPQEYLMKLSKIYGPIFTLKLGKRRAIVISSAEFAKQALKNHDIVFSGRPTLTCSQKLSYNGLDIGFAPYGEYWREMRKITVLHLLSHKKVQSFRHIHEDEIAKFRNQISVLSASSKPLINLRSTMVSLTSGIICRIAFGENGEADMAGHKILQETEELLGKFFVSDYFPWLGWIDQITGMIPRLERNAQKLDSFYEELIREHLNPNRPESEKNNILDLLIQLKEEQCSSVELTWNHIKAILTNIFIAGSESTAASIIWTMTALMKNPSTMKRLQTEIRASFGNKTVKHAEKLGDGNDQLPYLSAVIKEALRLYLPVPLLLPRETISSCSLGGYDIEPETLVFINAWAIARDPKTWENPNEFRPERFLKSDVDVVKGQHFELIPFGSGRRGCPGANLAIATIEIVVANLLNYFDWELPFGMKVEDIDTESLPGITMLPKNPLCLVAKKHVLN